MNGRRTVAAAIVAIVACFVLAGPAAADTPDSFTACVAATRTGGSCESGDIYAAGDKLWLRGKVRPEHAGLVAKILIRVQGDDAWNRVGSDSMSAHGRLKWTWRTTVDDANQDLYELRFKIPGHGVSEIATVLLLSGP